MHRCVNSSIEMHPNLLIAGQVVHCVLAAAASASARDQCGVPCEEVVLTTLCACSMMAYTTAVISADFTIKWALALAADSPMLLESALSNCRRVLETRIKGALRKSHTHIPVSRYILFDKVGKHLLVL